MQVTPVKRYPEPDFPTYAILYEHPELLRLVPKRWRGNPLVLAALAGVCTILWGCRSVSRADESKDDPKSGKSHPISLVAPIFKHGEGRGSFGCVSVNAPVFLSEDEARQVIVQEAKRAGISFDAKGLTIQQAAAPETDPTGFPIESSPSNSTITFARKRSTDRQPMQLDGTDQRRCISYEFVSASDFRDWERKGALGGIVDLYDHRGAAEVLRGELEEAKSPGSYAVFYDPMVYTDFWGIGRRAKERGAEQPHEEVWETVSNEAKNGARDELRKQVRDFIAWLKAQGVI